jgi:hypothetical protein
MMGDRAERLAKKLLEEGQKTLEFYRGLDEGQWGLEVYTEGACWRVQDVLAHFVVTEIGIPRIIQNILDGGEGSSGDFNLDEFNVRKVAGLENIPPVDLLARFQDLRQQTVRFVAGMGDAELDKVGRHPFLGQATVEDMLKLMYRHNQIHQRDLRRMFNA